MRWKLREFLESNQVTAYRLWKESGLAQQTVYNLSQNKGKTVDLGTLDKVLKTLSGLTQKEVGLNDVLEVKE